ncbi:hypothetical protein FJZ55_09470, partial [Candidatus Woesearchaeota archaeon]|nr:hypothetical protein [Candidatus Woesearchaeota archaeon]
MTDTIIVEEVIDTKVIASADQGPPGPPGEGHSFYVVASTAIGGHRVVKSTLTGCAYADSTDINDLGKILGVTFTATTQGSLAKIHTSGEIEEPTWNFTAGPVYLGTNGVLTQTLPVTGFIQQIGVAISP